MIVVESLLKEIFSQIPPISYNDVNLGETQVSVKFHWGNDRDLNLYLKQESGNTTPLIWLIPDKGKQYRGELHQRIKLILAKSSENRNSLNPAVWEREFVTVLDPLLVNVIKCLQQSSVTFIVNQEYEVYREANYSETTRDQKGSTESLVIDNWNVIIFEADVIFYDEPKCIQQINFNH